jgi:hypothetical protein
MKGVAPLSVRATYSAALFPDALCTRPCDLDAAADALCVGIVRGHVLNALMFVVALGFAAVIFFTVRAVSFLWTVNRQVAAATAVMVTAVLILSWFVSFPPR